MSTWTKAQELTDKQREAFFARLEPVADTDGCTRYRGQADAKGAGLVNVWAAGKPYQFRAHRLALVLGFIAGGGKAEDWDELERSTSNFTCGTWGCCTVEHLEKRSHAYYLTDHLHELEAARAADELARIQAIIGGPLPGVVPGA